MQTQTLHSSPVHAGGAFIAAALAGTFTLQGAPPALRRIVMSIAPSLAAGVKEMAQPSGLNSTAVNQAGQNLEREFNALAMQWLAETRHYSMEWQYVLHPAYQRIVGLGMAVVPLVLTEMQQHGGNWFHALEHITGDNPASRARTRAAAVDAWIAWGRARGLV